MSDSVNGNGREKKRRRFYLWYINKSFMVMENAKIVNKTDKISIKKLKKLKIIFNYLTAFVFLDIISSEKRCGSPPS